MATVSGYIKKDTSKSVINNDIVLKKDKKLDVSKGNFILSESQKKNIIESINTDINFNDSNLTTKKITLTETTEAPIIINSTEKIDNLHASEVTGDVDVSNYTLTTSKEQDKNITKNTFIFLDSSISDVEDFLTSNSITNDNFSDNATFIIKYGNNIYKFSLKSLLGLLYKYNDLDTINDISDFDDFQDNGVITLNYGDNFYKLNFGDLFLLLFRYYDIDIDVDITNYGNFFGSSYISFKNGNNLNKITVGNLFLLLFKYTSIDIDLDISNYINFFGNSYFSFKNGNSLSNITFNNLFLLFYKYTAIDIDNFSFSDISNYIFSLNFGTNIYNLTLNNLFLFLFRKTTNITYNNTLNINSYRIAINNSTTNYNITVTSLFEYLQSKINPSSVTSNITSSFSNGNIILDTKSNISAQSITITSDERYKTNIKKLESKDCLDKINQLEPKEFCYKENTNKKYFGFMAQELLDTDVSNIVDTNDKEHLKVDYNNLISLLVGSVKELTNEIKELKTENLELKNLIRNKNI